MKGHDHTIPALWHSGTLRHTAPEGGLGWALSTFGGMSMSLTSAGIGLLEEKSLVQMEPLSTPASLALQVAITKVPL